MQTSPLKPQAPVIRLGTAADAQSLAVLATQVWLHTYATEGVSDEIANYVLAELTPGKFLAALQAPSVRIMVAVQGVSLVGFAAVKRDEVCPAAGQRSTVELQTLYVQAHFVGQGVGTALLQAAESWARKEAGCALWLTVNTRNSKAIAFYQRHAYTQVGTAYFVLGTGRHENQVLAGPQA